MNLNIIKNSLHFDHQHLTAMHVTAFAARHFSGSDLVQCLADGGCDEMSVVVGGVP